MHQSFDSPQQLHYYLSKMTAHQWRWPRWIWGHGPLKQPTKIIVGSLPGGNETAVDCGVVIGMSDSLQHVRSLVTKERDRGYKIKLKISPVVITTIWWPFVVIMARYSIGG